MNQPDGSEQSGQPRAPGATSSVAPHPDCTPKQLAAIEKWKAEHPGIDPTPIVNLVMRMRENPKLEQALAQGIEELETKARPD